MALLNHQFARFCFVGTVGFGVDSVLTLLLGQVLHWTPLQARVAAFLVAATVTWALNRNFTFGSDVGTNTWFRYVSLTAIGAFINVGVYMLWLYVFGAKPSSVLLGIAFGSVAAMGFNFTVSKRFIFIVR